MVQIIGTGDTPILAGKTHFDPQEISFSSASDNTPYRVQMAYGTGTSAEALGANQYTESIIVPGTAPGPASDGEGLDEKMLRLVAGTKIWMRCWNAAVETLDLFIHVHEYPAGP